MVGHTRLLFRKLRRDLWHLRGQMLAVALVAACGIAMFVSLRSMHGWLRLTRDAYYARERFAEAFVQVTRAPEGIVERLRATPGIAAVATRIVRDVTIDLPGLPEPGTARLVSLPDTGMPVLNGVHLQLGRWPSPERSDEVIASHAFASANGLVPGDTLSAILNGRWQRLRIVGTGVSPEYVYEIRGLGDVFPDNRRFGVVWMRRAALASAFDLAGAFNDASMTLGAGASLPEVLARVDAVLAPYGGLGAYGRADQLSSLFLDSEIEETAVTSVLIPSIFLGVTAFLLHLVLSRLVAMQRDQIAVLKAFGYRNGTVAAHYLLLAATPVTLGALVGAILGTLLAGQLAGVYARFYQFPAAPYTQAPGPVVTAVAIALFAAVLGALLAVRRAVRLAPAEAMRPEPPARFRPGLVERLRVAAQLRGGGRMVLRGLVHRPWRTMLASLAIGLATAIVLVGWFLFDTVKAMERIQFEQVERHDIQVLFDTPAPARVRWALQRLDGVRQVEPFRVVGVRLRHGGRTERTAIQGFVPDGVLHRLVDVDGAVHPIPRGGVVLSDVVAERLGVGAGDTVTVEVLEGRRPVVPVVVAARHRDVLGTSAVMSLPALQALLDEPGQVSGAYLAVDPDRTTALFRTLRTLPRLNGVVVREAVVQGFRDTIAESFRISIVVLVGFASVIAGGVVYNGARVSLSERGRELASLRVLGFTRGEVVRVLLSEQAVLLVVGLPVGVALGAALAWMVTTWFTSDLFRLPFLVQGSTVTLAVLVVLASALVSALAVRRRIHRLDLIAVLKTRE